MSEDVSDVRLYDDLTGQVAVVTGATRGIGRRVAADLLELGATVYAGARNTDDVDVGVDNESVDGDLRPVELDVTEEREVVRAVERVDSEAGRLDAVVNNAGVMDTREPLDRMPTDAIDRTLRVNLRGPTVLTKHALPLLLADGGRIVNVTSGMGRISRMGSGSAAYRISKTGLNGLTAYLDAEYGDEGLLANAVSPGWVSTDMGGEKAPRTVAEGADTIVWLARFRDGPGGQIWFDREPVEW